MTPRKRPVIQLTLDPAELDRLAEMAKRSGDTQSRIVGRLIREAEMPRARKECKP